MVKDKQAVLEKIQKTFNTRKHTAEQFEDHAKSCVDKAVQYFKEKFDQHDAPLKQMMDLFSAARVCDPTVLIDSDIDKIHDDLEFLGGVITRIDVTRLKNEVPSK